jgi:hypothetical protein
MCKTHGHVHTCTHVISGTTVVEGLSLLAVLTYIQQRKKSCLLASRFFRWCLDWKKRELLCPVWDILSLDTDSAYVDGSIFCPNMLSIHYVDVQEGRGDQLSTVHYVIQTLKFCSAVCVVIRLWSDWPGNLGSVCNRVRNLTLPNKGHTYSWSHKVVFSVDEAAEACCLHFVLYFRLHGSLRTLFYMSFRSDANLIKGTTVLPV